MLPYAKSLGKEVKICYKDKNCLINGVDPFKKLTEGEPLDGIPPVEDCD